MVGNGFIGDMQVRFMPELCILVGKTLPAISTCLGIREKGFVSENPAFGGDIHAE